MPGKKMFLASAAGAVGTVYGAQDASADEVKVKPNDTIKKIANDYGATATQVAAENGINNDNKLTVGSKLDVHEGNKKGYKVKSNDSLYGISKENGVSVNQIIKLNNLSQDSVLYEGQKLNLGYIKPKEITKEPLMRYEIQDDETANEVAESYGLSVKYLQKLNPKVDMNKLQNGDQIVINAKNIINQNAAEEDTQAVDYDASGTPSQINPMNTNDKTRNAIVNMALKLANSGIPYVWGGTDPNSGLDCSGLVKYVFAHAANTEVNRTSEEQDKQFKHISISDAKPGDLIFWNHGGDVDHVAIYIGNNQYVAAPAPGMNVRVETIDKSFMPSYAGSIE